MASTILLATAALFAYWVYTNVSGLRKNIAEAKKTGLPYVIAPVTLYNSAWLLFSELFVPLIKKLPHSWWESWLDITKPDWTWNLQHEPFKKLGDAFSVVSPGALHIYFANAEAILQITSKREAFPKPLESYKLIDAFGRNILSTEGAEWKTHRKVSSPSFNEVNNALVFAEATRQAKGMLRKWTSEKNLTITEAPTDTMRLTLHIITSVGFGVNLLWPGEEVTEKQDMETAVFSSNEPPEGHTMSFENSLTIFLEYLFLILLVPKWIIRILPFKSTKEAYTSYIEWKQYMDELFALKIQEARDGKVTEGMDIMGALVRSSYGKVEKGRTPGSVEKGEVSKPTLSDSDILGNAFIMILAGHETTANSIHFSMMELAINPKSQRATQKEIDNIFGDKPSEKWEYESSINALLGGMVGAVLNEELRLMPPVIAIPKMVSTTSPDQSIVIDGKTHIIPSGARISLATPSVACNPRYWPTQPSKITDRKDDLQDFRPERWLLKSSGESVDVDSDHEVDKEFGGFTGQDTHAKLFRPVRGSYLPFSEGARSCVGRRLAQVKVMAVLATIFQTHSIELAVDEWATDDEVAKMTKDEKRELYKKAQVAARKMIKSATSRITLKLHPGFVAVRVVKRGEERFVDFVE